MHCRSRCAASGFNGLSQRPDVCLLHSHSFINETAVNLPPVSPSKSAHKLSKDRPTSARWSCPRLPASRRVALHDGQWFCLTDKHCPSRKGNPVKRSDCVRVRLFVCSGVRQRSVKILQLNERDKVKTRRHAA